MSEKFYYRPCAVCSCDLDITLDTLTDDIVIRAHNLEPLAKDKLTVVSRYRQLKGLGSDWRAKHEPRAIIYAGTLLEASGPLGGALERVLGLLGWLKEQGKDFNLESAATYFQAYLESVKAKEQASRGRCAVCGESFAGQGNRCPSHVWVKDEEI